MKTYNDAIDRLKNLNNMKHKLRKALGNIGIYLPLEAGMQQVLFCVYVYYMFNLFGDNNSKWKEKYFPLDGLTLYNFIENRMASNPTANKIYIDIANEIEAVTYPGRIESENIILNRGLLEDFIEYSRNNDMKNKIGEISNNTINTDNVLTNTKGLLNKLLSIWKWKKYVIDSTRRKRKEDNRTPVIEENVLLDEILRELQKEAIYRLPSLKLENVKLTTNDMDINSGISWAYKSVNHPFTIYNTPKDTSFSLDVGTKKLFSPFNWVYNYDMTIGNIRPNTSIKLYYKLKSGTQQYDLSTEFSQYDESGSYNNSSWDNRTTTKMQLYHIKSGNNVNVGYKDKYNGIYDKKNGYANVFSYLGWKPEIFLYSKSIRVLKPATEGGSDGDIDVSKSGPKDSPIDYMNTLDEKDFSNLGLTILVPNVVEKYMKEKVPRFTEQQFSNEQDFNIWSDLNSISLIRDMETIFLVGIYPVDNDNNIIYNDPIVFQYFSGAQLNEDLGLSFADYRKIKSPSTKDKVLLRKYYNIKLGQMFYRNNYSRISTEKKITNITTAFDESGKESLTSVIYEDTKVGDVSKNLLYLYGRDNYMPYVGKTSLSPGQNHNVTNPDDNTYIENINLPDNTEYVFKKYGSTKIAIQLYMATNNNSNMDGLDYFKKIKEAKSGIIENDYNTTSSEKLEKIPGSFMGLPYTTENVWDTIQKNKAFPYNETDILNKKIPFPDWNVNNDHFMSVYNPRGLAFITEPTIIDCNKGDEYNAPWLDKRNAPYVAKVVTEDFNYYTENPDNVIDRSPFRIMKRGIYIKIPSELDLYMLNDESVKKYEKRKRFSMTDTENVLEDKEFYGRIKREQYIRAIKNALVGISINYEPKYNPGIEGNKNPSWFNTSTASSKLFRSNRFFDIVEYGKDLYLRLNGYTFADLEYAGLGKYGTVKVQLFFRNEFFRSDDPDSPLNYKFVPVTGDVQLLREIAGQRIKLYRGGILAHPTEYRSKEERMIYRKEFSGTWTVDLDRTKEVAYKHNYTNGFPTYGLNNNLLADEENIYRYLDLNDDNSVYDMISIEMDYPHWQELQINNIERSPISSMETDVNKNSLPIPINLIDLENYDFLEYNINKDSYLDTQISNASENKNIRPKLLLCQPNNDRSTYVSEYIDFYRLLNFWYIFRPKVKFMNDFGTEGKTEISIENYNDWKSRILRENRDYFNRSNVKLPNYNNDLNGLSYPYNIDTSERIIDLEDILNIRCYQTNYNSPHELNIVSKDSDSRNLYNILKYILLDHTIYVEGLYGQNVSSEPKSFNIQNFKKAKFGGYILDRLLYSDWVFTHRLGDSKKVDDIIRKAANDTALDLFNIWSSTVRDIQIKIRDSNMSGGMYGGGIQQINITDNVKKVFENLLNEYMFVEKSNNDNDKDLNNIYVNRPDTTQYVSAIEVPGENRLIDFEKNINCELKTGYVNADAQPNNVVTFNVHDHRTYKGDNRKLDKYNSKAKLRRGFRMGYKTPDNPFMGFSMPATTNPDDVPDNIHLVYCDIYWKDFDKTQTALTFTPTLSFNIDSNDPDKNIIYDNGNGLRYDFSGVVGKFHLNRWKGKMKHVIFRILSDVPTKEQHKDCPEYIKGEYYDNKYGKGFSPNFKDEFVRLHYKYAVLAFRRWLNEHYGQFNGMVYTVEIPIGMNGSGYISNGGNIEPLTEIKVFIKDIYNEFNGYDEFNGYVFNSYVFNIIGEQHVECKLVFSSSIEIMMQLYGWSFNNLGRREEFEEWMKYNMYGSDSIMRDTIDGGYKHGGSVQSSYRYSTNNKFKSTNQNLGYSGVIRSDLSMEELMKSDNFRELLYEMKTLTPMYVIGYIDKEKYPEQYELLMNEMGYKYTITSAVIEDGYLKVYFSNEGKNGIESLSYYASLNMILKYKGKLNNPNIRVSTSSIIRTQSGSALNSIGDIYYSLIDYTNINMGDVLMFKSMSPKITGGIRPYVRNKEIPYSDGVELAYGKNMVDDIYLELLMYVGYDTKITPIKIANINRTTEINLTDSGLLHMFYTNSDREGRLDKWFDTMYMNKIKVDDNGWI